MIQVFRHFCPNYKGKAPVNLCELIDVLEEEGEDALIPQLHSLCDEQGFNLQDICTCIDALPDDDDDDDDEYEDESDESDSNEDDS